MSDEGLWALEASHVVLGWQRQDIRSQLIVDRVDGSFLWDVTGKRYCDFGAGQINVNVGYNHPHVIAAMRKQMERAVYVAPNFATDVRIRLSSMIAARTPGDLQYIFFTNSGSEAIENAIKIARAATGRLKIYSAWQSYHGATAGASAISGDPRRLHIGPAIPGVEKFHYATCYRCPFNQVGPPSCNFACLHSLEAQILFDGPETVAAIVLEPIVGTSGLYIPPPQFISGIRRLCDEHGILLIFDETMSGWGRTGRWFGCDHYQVAPDILVTAKGVTSGYVPLGVVALTPRVRDHFLKKPFVGGLTNEGHALACAAGIANIEVYENEQLVARSARLGEYLNERLLMLRERHISVGDVRCKGLFACLELTSDRARKRPLAGYRDRFTSVASELSRRLREMGLIVITKWDFVFIAPPLTITEDEIDEGIAKIDFVLDHTDRLVQDNAS
jgi:taurine---2-oxoglutarate transaminase